MPQKKRLTEALARVMELRRSLGADPQEAARWQAVKRYQAARLERTYADLLGSPRYRAAAVFFLEDLYGEKNFEQRDREALRVLPKIARLLPERAVETLALAVELDELSEILDARVARHVVMPLDDASYARAYYLAGTRAERVQQIEMVERIGKALDWLARMPLISGMLHVMRGPAESAGLLHLHEFLVRGFDSFKAMKGAREFLATVRTREIALMESLLAGPSDARTAR